jgi:probable HAF family extracellular repeat protein
MKRSIRTSTIAPILIAALVAPIQLIAQEKNQAHYRYKFIDLGTLGGPTSYLSVNGAPTRILNNSGIVWSAADTATTDPNAPNLCYNPDCFLTHAFRWQDGVMTDMGALPGTNGSAAGAINGRGWAVGQSQNGVMDPLLGVLETRAVLWEDGKIIDLGTLGGNESLAIWVNNSVQVAGVSANTIPDPVSMFGFGTQTRAFLWQNGVIQDLGTLGGPDAFPATMNERGQVVGSSFTNATPNPVTGVPTTHPFLWDHGTMVDLGTLGGTNAGAGVVNDRGQVAGFSTLAGDIDAHGFLWDQGTLSDLGTLGGTFSTTVGLNDAGDVVGGATTPGDTLFHATLWRKGAITDLGTLDGDCFSLAIAINARGQIVGHSVSCDGSKMRAVLWESGSILDLNTVVPAGSNLLLVEAANINGRGEILGQGFPPGVQSGDFGGHDFLLVPCGVNDEGCQDSATVAVASTPTKVAGDPLKTSQIVAEWRARLARRQPQRSAGFEAGVTH